MSTFQFFLKYLKKYKKYISLTIFFLLLESLVEIISPMILSNIVQKGIGNYDQNYIFYSFILLVVLTLIGVIGSILSSYFSSHFSSGLIYDLRKDVFEAISSLSFLEIDKLDISKATTILSNDIEIIGTTVSYGIKILFKVPLLFIGSLFFSFLLSRKLFFIFIIILLIMSILIYIILKKAYPYFDSTQEALDSVNKVVRENISGKRLIKVMHTEVEENKKFRKANKKLLEQNIKAMQTVTRVSPVMMLFIYILTYFVLLFGKNGMLEIGNLMAVLQYLTIMLTSLLMGAMLLLLCSQIGVSLKRVVSICNMPSYDRKEGTLPFQNNNLILKNVSFSYGENTKEALKNINIEIKKGERVAVVGRCGSGKTTLLKMMAGFYLPDKGEVLLGNQSLFAYQNMREKMIYNSQKMVFFKGTIKENILWFQKEKIDKSILKISKVDSILSKKEQGLSSSIEAFGSNLSGGEKNRISLARCLNRDFEVLLLDDSLSAVDLKTERKILNSLFAHSKGKTIIYATSRLTFLEKMDKIIVLEKGKIEACGTLEEVLGNSLFQELYALAKEVQNGR